MKRRFERLAYWVGKAAEAPYGGFVGDPETHGIDEPRGGGFSIMQDLQRDLVTEQGRTAADALVGPVEMDPIDVMAQYTADVGRELLKLRRAYGLLGIRQNYKGTGSQRAKRQLFVRLPTDEGVDVWLEMRSYQIGGVTNLRMPGSFSYDGRTPAQVAKDIADKLKMLAERNREASDRSGLRSRRAMYWGAPGRTYRLTRGEQENGVATCPRCRAEMEKEPFVRGERMWVCQKCRFKVPTSKAVTKIQVEVQPDGEVEVDVTTAGGKGKEKTGRRCR